MEPDFEGIEWDDACEYFREGINCGMDTSGNCEKAADECKACPLAIEIRRVIRD